MRKKTLRLRISFITGFIGWVLMTSVSLIIVFSRSNEIKHGIPDELPYIFYLIFFTSVYLFYKIRLSRLKDVNLQDLLWRVFVTGLIATVVSLIFKIIESLIISHRIGENPLLINFNNSIHLGVVTAFFISTMIVWEKFIFYQKTKRLIISWRIFEYIILFSLLIPLFNIIPPFTIYYLIFLGIMLLTGIYFSANLKWVAYLNFKQKWKSILLFALIIIYLFYFIIQLYNKSMEQADVLIIDGFFNITVTSLWIFIFLYAFISVLVILFNLPTSSVFEKKLEEIINFQRLSQSRNTGKNEEEVYDILLDSSVSAVLADAAWLEANKPVDKDYRRLTHRISAEEINQVKEKITHSRTRQIVSSDPIKNLKSDRYIASIRNHRFRSVLVFPIFVQNESIGSMVLLKEISDGFNEEMINVIRTFVNQASISIENFKLIEAAIENEQYKKELNIAKAVQRSLLPSRLDHSQFFDIIAYSKSADEVGGDYYDIFKVDENRTIVIIGDVSGKGTSAAFHMSQLKGIFHSLVQLDLSTCEFMVYANKALAKGLDKSSFITASIYFIDKQSGTIEFCRAGHCPTLFYQNKKKEATYYTGKGLGLGILRNNEFQKYVNNDRIFFEQEDLLVLYTDGITEARNYKDEEFGYERLKKLILENAGQPPEKIKESIIDALYMYCKTNAPNDDYTLIIIKFK